LQEANANWIPVAKQPGLAIFLARFDFGFVDFRQSIYKTIAFISEISTQVNDNCIYQEKDEFPKILSFRHGEVPRKTASMPSVSTLSVKIKSVSPIKVGMGIGYFFSFLAIAVHIHQVAIGVVNQKTKQFPSGISCCTDNRCFNLLHGG
jgi:hypothetical protein